MALAFEMRISGPVRSLRSPLHGDSFIYSLAGRGQLSRSESPLLSYFTPSHKRGKKQTENLSMELSTVAAAGGNFSGSENKGVHGNRYIQDVQDLYISTLTSNYD